MAVSRSLKERLRNHETVFGTFYRRPGGYGNVIQSGTRCILCNSDAGRFAKSLKAAVAQFEPYRKN